MLKKVELHGLQKGMPIVGAGAGERMYSGTVMDVTTDKDSGIATIKFSKGKRKGDSREVVWNPDTSAWGSRGASGTLYHPPKAKHLREYDGSHKGKHYKRKDGVKRAYHRKVKEIPLEVGKVDEKGFISREALLARRLRLQQEIIWIDGLLK